MGLQGRVILNVPNEIVLQMVEWMDPLTRGSFMATSKEVYELIKSHERSISRAQVAAFALRPVGSVLSSATEERHVIEEYTFAMTSELERRESRIDSLLSECPGLFCLVSPPSLPAFSAAGQTRMAPLLKRALQQCDRIADIAADESPLQPESYRVVLDGNWKAPPTSALHTDVEKLNPLANPKARPKQIEYIRSLSLEDAAGLFVLLSLVGYGMMVAHLSHYAMGFEGKVCAEECVLRHGTWFIWKWLRGGRFLPEFILYMLLSGRAELRAWESGAVTGPDGLKMTLTGRLRALYGGVSSVELHEKIEQTIKKLISDGDAS